ncbi:MAG: type II toxin-antitoxin system VapC family toxin [Endomicrobium sp.]|jgi:tRNA(fMet)-specific endonuclease VapC|nr:type II toxin-antitoxin system VapC family toxin [Endomicrobium sp.]
MYLLDTNTCIYIIKKKYDSVLRTVEKKRYKGLAISTITLSELQFGIENSLQKEKNTIALMEFLSIIDILSFDENAAKEYGIIKTDLKKRKCLIGELDMLIAAHGKAHNLIVVTNNMNEFERIENLKLENWV